MKQNKVISILLVLTLLLSACSAKAPSDAEAAVNLTPGTYEGTADGFGGTLKVAVTVDTDKITAIDVLEQTETPALGGAAITQLSAAILDKQSLAVDAVSGCTVTSTAFIEAVKGALSQSGADIDAMMRPVKVSNETKDTVSLSTQVVVVGAGGSGLAAAVSAAQGGAEVLVLEKMAFAGGATAMAGGGTNATGSERQKSVGIEDKPEWLFMDLMLNGHFSNDPNTVWLYANTVGKAFDWLVAEDGAGIAYKDQVPSPSAEHRVGRTFSPEGAGSGVVSSLLAKAESLGVKIMYNTPAKELIAKDGKVTGVKALSTDGVPYEITADAVILASGGYGANEKRLNDSVRSLAYAGAVSATGDGLEMALAVGADSLNLDKINIQPHSIVLPDGRGQHTFQGCLAMYGGTGSILVSEKGVRFVNERGSADSIKMAMENNKHSYLVMDSASFETYAKTCIDSKNYTQEQLDTWLAANGTMTPVFAKADSLEELAGIVSMPGDALAASVEKYNDFVEKGVDEEYGRKVSAPMAKEGPYYLVEMNLRYYASLGGLRINDKMQVVSTTGDALDGLYAAGEIVGGLCGDIYAPGALFGWAMTSGYNAGTSVATTLNNK